MTYRIRGLAPQQFEGFFALQDEPLKQLNIHTVIADDSKPGFPCRISLQDANPGERLLLINHEHLPVDSPYRSSHAIYVSEGSKFAADVMNEVPSPLRERILSVRAFDASDMMVDADIVDGEMAHELIEKMFENKAVQYLHIHFAKRGCFAAKVERI